MTDNEKFAIKRFMSLCFIYSKFDGMLYTEILEYSNIPTLIRKLKEVIELFEKDGIRIIEGE